MKKNFCLLQVLVMLVFAFVSCEKESNNLNLYEEHIEFKNLNCGIMHNEICELFLAELSNYNDSLVSEDLADSIFLELFKDSGITKELLDSSRNKSRILREFTTCDILKSSGRNYSAEEMKVYAKVDEALASYSKDGDFSVFKMNLDVAKVKAKNLSYNNEVCANAIIDLAEASVRLWEKHFDGEPTEKYMNIVDCATSDINAYQDILQFYEFVRENGGKVHRDKITKIREAHFVAEASICAYLDIDFHKIYYK